MRRTLPLAVLLVALPFLAAAPVPKGEAAVATSYSAEELAKLPFMDADAPPAGKTDTGYPKAKTVALAVTLPKSSYDLGEPIIPLFAVKNRTDKPLGLDMRLDFSGGALAEMNSCEVCVHDAGTGQKAGQSRLKVMACGSRSLVTVRADGYLVTCGNVNAIDRPLPPGKYELSWRYGWAESNFVKFTVTDRPTKKAAAYKFVALMHVTESDPDKPLEKKLDERDEPKEWKEPGLTPIRASGAAAALGDGTYGRFYPSLRSLPEATASLRAETVWRTEDHRDSFTLTLSVAETGKKVRVDDDLHVYLLFESDAPFEDERRTQDLFAQKAAYVELSSDSPYHLTVRLPENWAGRCGTKGNGRVAVVVSTQEFVDNSGEKLLKAEVEKRSNDGDTTDAGEFVVRTPWRDVTFPDPPKAEK